MQMQVAHPSPEHLGKDERAGQDTDVGDWGMQVARVLACPFTQQEPDFR